MPDTTRNLGLPLIAAAQAQKHVTHNEALGALDALVQLACLDKDLAAPPANPAEGDRYLVTAASPTGAWSGLSGQVVRFVDGVWAGAAPRPGWLAYLIDEADLYVFTGTIWTSFSASLKVLQNLSRLGIGTAADAANRFALKSDAALLTWDDVTPGSGHLRVSLNKQAPARDAALTFQTGYSTRALFGTLGSDQVTLKVSPDGASFAQAFTVDPASGRMGLLLTGAPAAGLHLTSVRQAPDGGSGAYPGRVNQEIQINAYGGDTAGANAAAATLVGQIARGNPATPLAIKAGDRFFGLLGSGLRSDGAYSGTVVAVQATAEEDFTGSANGTMVEVAVTAAGATARRTSARLRANGTLELVPQAADPATGLAQGQVYVSSTATALKWYTGTAWARLNNFAKAAATTNFDNYVPAGSWTKVQFNSADANDQGAFLAASNRFVAPEAGLYGVGVALGYKRNGASAPSAFEVQFYRNGAPAGRGRAAATGALVDGVTTLGLSSALKLAAGDAVEVFVRFTGADGYVAAADSLFGVRQMA